MDGHLFVQIDRVEWIAIADIHSIVYVDGIFVLWVKGQGDIYEVKVAPEYAIMVKRLLRMSAIGRTDLDFITEAK